MKKETKETENAVNENQESSLALTSNAIAHIGSSLDTQSLGSFSSTCRSTYFALKPSLMTRKAERLLKILMNAMNENPNGIIKLMQYDTTQTGQTCVVLQKVPGIEPCGREWKAVSPLEFAVWAGEDQKTVESLIQYVPSSQRHIALAQLMHLEGLEHGKPLAAFEILIAEYQDYITKYGDRSDDEQADASVKGIGGKQYLAPIVGLQWYCNPEPFDPIPNLNRAPKRSCTAFDGYCLISPSGVVFDDLGQEFYLFKYGRGAPRGCGVAMLGWGRAAVTFFNKFCEVRQSELKAIIQGLQIQPEETSKKSACQLL